MEGLQQLVSAEKVSPDAAEKLRLLQPGAYCTHRSWGFGQVVSWDMVLEQIVIDFEGRRGHSMKFPYAAESLTPLAADHILARKRTDIEGVRSQSAEDPAGLMECVVRSLDRTATPATIEAALCPDVIAKDAWKKWWETARRAMKKHGHFVIPTSKNSPLEMRAERPEEAGRDAGEFLVVKGAKAQVAWITAVLKRLASGAAGAATFKPVIERAEDTLRKTTHTLNGDLVQLALVRDELAERLGVPIAPDVSTTRILGSLRDLCGVIDSLPSASQARALAVLSASQPGRFTERTASLLAIASQRLAASIADFYRQKGDGAGFCELLRRGLREHGLSSDVLVWLLRNRKDEGLGDLVEPRMFGTVLAGIERDQSGGGRATRLHDSVVADKTLLSEVLAGADAPVVRDITRAILLTPVFSDMDRRSILGRLVKEFPEAQKLVGEARARSRPGTSAQTEVAKSADRLIVSWASLEQRKQEIEDLIKKKIPANTKEIAVARSYGDLSENAEFKFAKEQQRVLQRRRAELEQEIMLATGTDFKGTDATRAGIGTVVTLNHEGNREVYTILGAWDTDPAQHVISYLTPLAKALSQRQVGDRVTVPGDKPGTTREVTIEQIKAFNS